MLRTKNEDIKIVLLENETYRVQLVPRLGGKVASIERKKDGFEFLFQPKNVYKLPCIYDDFSCYQPSGIDDCFPNIDGESIVFRGKEMVYPDHGEVWSADLRCERLSSDTILMEFESSVFHYRYRKEIHLSGSSLTMSYEIINTGNDVFPCFYTFHGLFRMEHDMKILYPQGAEKILNVMDHTILGKAGTEHNFPISSGHDFRLLPREVEPYMMKYYVGNELKNSGCGFIYPTQEASVRFEYDANKLPYLGLWMTQGGYQGDRNIALEPSSGFYDSVSKALDHEKLNLLSPGEGWKFQIKLTLS